MNILHDPIEKTVNTIRLPWESYLYLQSKLRTRPMSDDFIDRLHGNFDRFSHNGLHTIGDRDLGWSVPVMAAMLDEQGLPYEYGEPQRRIYL